MSDEVSHNKGLKARDDDAGRLKAHWLPKISFHSSVGDLDTFISLLSKQVAKMKKLRKDLMVP